MDNKALFERLDKIIVLLETVAKQPSLLIRLFDLRPAGAVCCSLVGAFHSRHSAF